MEEKVKFDGIFESFLFINGLFFGDKVKLVFMNLKLFFDVLGRVSGAFVFCIVLSLVGFGLVFYSYL